MSKDWMKAKELVCAAGKRLLSEGLVARTWGNVSIRVSDTEMIITPSGRMYQDLQPDDMVLVNIHTLKYEGLKPSSELKLHCEIYKKRPDVQAIIHTHQMYGSIVAAAQRDVLVLNDEWVRILGTELVRAAPYALPNTRKITVETARAVGDANAALMSNHGVVCTGKDIDNAFEVALTLEKACAFFIEREKQKLRA